MCFKEGARILKRAYALQRGPTYVLQRESKVFKEGLHTSMGASVLKRVHV